MIGIITVIIRLGLFFQNYHLINHISIIENVEMGMALSGVSP